jgi:hypothetical protein
MTFNLEKFKTTFFREATSFTQDSRSSDTISKKTIDPRGSQEAVSTPLPMNALNAVKVIWCGNCGMHETYMGPINQSVLTCPVCSSSISRIFTYRKKAETNPDAA